MFHKIIKKYENFEYDNFFENVTLENIKQIIRKSGEKNLSDLEFLSLLSPKADDLLEEMAIKSNEITKRNFGKEMHLYAPIYISNICDNECTYCGFKKSNVIKRRHLSLEEIEIEAKYISENLGIHSIILLTGESNVNSIEYIKNSIEILKKYFATVIIEIQPLDIVDYETLVEAGLDGVTVYQECYEENLYGKYHLKGKKSDYFYRLDTPERAAIADIRNVNIGALFGLGNVKKEAFLAGIHGKYLMDKFLNTEFSISIPRIKEAYQNIKLENILSDREFVQILLAYRISFPTLGINISTRENGEFRDNLIPLGVTKFSAGSVTEVGGYCISKNTTPQFETSDHRSVEEIVLMLKEKDYQPVFKNWEGI
ncbi:MAG: 2-iminoacetate synthase ThiH [Cetobacterium sp.]